MIVDAHVHIWKREMLPDQAIRSYLEPVRRFQEMYGGLFDFGLDDEVPFSDYDSRNEYLFESLTLNRIDRAVVLGTDFELVGDGRMTNMEYMDWLFSVCSTDDRLVPFIGVDLARGAGALEMLDSLMRKHSPRGLKLYPATGFYPDDERYDPFWDLVDSYGLAVTVHAGMALPPLDERYCHPSSLARPAEMHPDVKIIVAHLGGKFHSELLPLMDAHENVFADCSALQGWMPEDPGMVDARLSEAVSRHPDRIVFGTDFPLYENHTSTGAFMRRVREGAWGGEREKEALLGGNMARILGL